MLDVRCTILILARRWRGEFCGAEAEGMWWGCAREWLESGGRGVRVLFRVFYRLASMRRVRNGLNEPGEDFTGTRAG